MFGSALSGGYGGNLAGFEAGWSGNVEPEEEPYKLWDTMTFPASYQARYFRDFLLSEGKRYQELIPDANLLSPSQAGPHAGWRGWAFCSATRERDLVLCYTEKDCPNVRLRGLRPYDKYEVTIFDPRTGQWLEEKHQYEVNCFGSIALPHMPNDTDWAYKVKRLNSDARVDIQDEGLGMKQGYEIYRIETDSKK